MTTHHHPKGLHMDRYAHTRPAHRDLSGLSSRQAERIASGSALETERAIRCARLRGDWQTVELMTAEFLALRGQTTRPADAADGSPRDRAGVLARLPLIERVGLS